MLLHYLVVHILEALGKLGGNLLFVTDAEILQVEGFGMACSGTNGTPLGVDIAVGPLDEVKGILYPLVHILHSNDFLGLVLHAPATVYALTAYTARQNGKGLHAHVLT